MTKHRGCNFYIGHYLVISDIQLLVPWKKQIRKDREPLNVIKYLLQEESIHNLYQQLLEKQLAMKVIRIKKI